MSEKIYDWKGNEIKEGMIIYFVQTKPGILDSSRLGIMMIDRAGMPHQVLEPEENWAERKNKQFWNLGEEMIVYANKNGTKLHKTNS